MLGRYLLHRLDTEPGPHPGPHSELSGSFGAHVLGASELLWLFPSLLESWCSRGGPSRSALGPKTYNVLVTSVFFVEWHSRLLKV